MRRVARRPASCRPTLTLLVAEATALLAGVVVAAAALTGLMRRQNSAWIRRGIVVPRCRSRAKLNPPGQSARSAVSWLP